MKTPTRKQKWPLDEGRVRAVQLAVERVLAVKLKPEGIGEMLADEQAELFRLAGKIYSEKIPREHLRAISDEKARQRAEADQVIARLEASPPPSGLERKYQELSSHNSTMLAELTRKQGRPPSVEQARVVLENLNPAATLDDLRPSIPAVPELLPTSIETFSSLEGLKGEEIPRLEELVEKAAGKPGLFQKRRDNVQLKTKGREALNRMLKVPPRRRRHYEEPGAVVLPPALFADVRDGILWLPDLAPLAMILSAFEARELWSERHRFEDGGETIVICNSFGGDLDLDPERRLSIDKALTHLNRAEWLAVDKSVTVGAQKTEQRIKLGRLAIEANTRRPDAS